MSESVDNDDHEANNGQGNGAMLRYGRLGIQSNEEWIYSIKLEKSYGGIKNGNSVKLVQDYMEAFIKVID